MELASIKRLAKAAAAHLRKAGVTQKEVAKAVGASQSQVSRVLSGKSKRCSRLFKEICIYVNNSSRIVSRDVIFENDELMDAIASVWDGTPRQATAIATVIRSLGVMSPPIRPDSNQRSSKRGKGE